MRGERRAPGGSPQSPTMMSTPSLRWRYSYYASVSSRNHAHVDVDVDLEENGVDRHPIGELRGTKKTLASIHSTIQTPVHPFR